MDIKQQDMAGSGILGGPNAQSILAALAATEKEEAAVYTRIAQSVPSPELCRLILHRARHELSQAARIALLLQYFGVIPCGPPGMSYSAGEGKRDK